MSLFTELKRRNVFRVGIAYVITAWLLAQVADLALGNFGAPDWVIKSILLLLLIGFPIALIFAWAFELTPEGLKRDHEVERSESSRSANAGKLDRAIIAVLVLAVGWFSWDKFIADPKRDAAELEARLQEAAQQQSPEPVADAGSDRTIAVLPFVNMSADAENEYFSDGISEEILNVLADIPQLQVTARTSAFTFKGSDRSISEIAQELGVAHVLEGSVRKAGNEVRITAQLIKADDGFHLWSDTYDRTLDDIFATQDEIAVAVAEALRVTLIGVADSDPPTSPEAYEEFLKGMHLMTNQRNAEGLVNAKLALQKAIELDPAYAEAWATLAMVYQYQAGSAWVPRQEGVELAMQAAQRALTLDPESGVAWGVFGFLKKNWERDWDTAQTALERAHELDPRRNAILIWRASLASSLGDPAKAIELYEQANQADPLNSSAYSALGLIYLRTGRFDEAAGIFEKQLQLWPDYHWAWFNLGRTHLLQGHAERALEEMQKNPPNIWGHMGLAMAYSSLGQRVEADAALQELVSEYGETQPGWISEVYAWRGDLDQAFMWLDRGRTEEDAGLAYILNIVSYDPLKNDPRWTELLEQIGLLEYWQAMPPEHGGPPP